MLKSLAARAAAVMSGVLAASVAIVGLSDTAPAESYYSGGYAIM